MLVLSRLTFHRKFDFICLSVSYFIFIYPVPWVIYWLYVIFALFLKDQKYMVKFLACVCVQSLVYTEKERLPASSATIAYIEREIDLIFSFLTALTLYSLLSYNQVFSPSHSLSGSSVQQSDTTTKGSAACQGFQREALSRKMDCESIKETDGLELL